MFTRENKNLAKISTNTVLNLKYTPIQPNHYCGVPTVKLWCSEIGSAYQFVKVLPPVEGACVEWYGKCALN